jgi:hypothetical protein
MYFKNTARGRFLPKMEIYFYIIRQIGIFLIPTPTIKKIPTLVF